MYFNYIATLPVGRQPEWLSLTCCSIPGTPNHCLLGPRNRTVKTAGFQGGQPWVPILSLSLPDVYEPVHASEPLVPHAQTRLLMGEQAGRGGYWAPIRGNRAPAMSPPSLNEESLSLRPPPCVFTSKQVQIVHDWFSELEGTLPLAPLVPHEQTRVASGTNVVLLAGLLSYLLGISQPTDLSN